MSLAEELAMARAAREAEPMTLDECARLLGVLRDGQLVERAALVRCLGFLIAEHDRIMSGDFTAAEVQWFCHKVPLACSAREFADGCAAYQYLIYGCAPDADAVPPREPPAALIDSMCLRYRHDFGIERNLDKTVGAGVVFGCGMTEPERDALRSQMRQLYEEATGQGFYKHRRGERRRGAASRSTWDRTERRAGKDRRP